MPDTDLQVFDRFQKSGDALWLRAGGATLFRSTKGGLMGLVDYLSATEELERPAVTAFDKVVGNAAALLLVAAKCREVYSPTGSQRAIDTLDRHGVGCHFTNVLPAILNRDGTDLCPMEKLSAGKSPEEFARMAAVGFKAPAP